jgi:hypothetical protein
VGVGVGGAAMQGVVAVSKKHARATRNGLMASD